MTNDMQKAAVSKRIAAFMLDWMLTFLLAFGLGLLLSSLFQFQGYVDTVSAGYEKYEAQYGVQLMITQEDYNALSAEEKHLFDQATDAANADRELVYAFNMVLNLTFVILTVCVLLSMLTVEFLIPLKLGNGQTVGKKIFGLAVMRVDGVKLQPMLLFVRTLLGKYTIETMVPLLIIVMILLGILGLSGTLLLAAILVVQLVLMFVTKTNSAIHDKLANTVVVDMASQRIFGSELELIAHKERLNAEKAAKTKYF